MMKRIFILITLTIAGYTSCIAQFDMDFCNDIDDKKLIKKYDKAVDLLMSGKLVDAELAFAKVINEEPDFTEAWLAIAEINYSRYSSAQDQKSQNKYYGKYVKCLEKVSSTCPSFEEYEISYKLGKIFFSRDNFDVAAKHLNLYVNKGNKKSKFYSDAENTLSYIESYLNLIQNPVPFKPVVVDGISTINDDYLPIISPDGTMAFYTHAYIKKDVTSIYSDKFTEEFTMSRALDNSGLNFSNGEALPYPFNTGKNQGASSITIDNSTLYLTICEFVSRDYDNCDIFYATKKNTGWSELQNLGTNINGLRSWESQPTISSDGKTLYFASIRESNIGFDVNSPTSDIYFSEKQEDNSWGKAQNMGPSINTSGNDKSPFIHSDSQTLYFSSDGHLGIGGFDIFFSKYRDNGWTKPINIGYPINTKRNDLGFVVNTQGTNAYFASNKLSGAGGWDIYSIELYPEARPEKVFIIKGQLIDDVGEIVTEAKLEIRNTRTEEVSHGVVDAETGNYAIAVTVEEEEYMDDFIMVVKKEDYSFTSALLEINEDVFEEPEVLNFEIKPIEPGKAVELNDIYFPTASFIIDTKSLIVLDSFVEFLNDNPNVKIEIRGHTDNTGSYSTNMDLSNRRAKSVYDYLLSKNIATNRVSYKGYGPKLPLESNDTEWGRYKNRRTEFFITEK